MSQKQRQEREARLRAELIVQVRGGTLRAAAAARRLGVSRKTYYKWERRGLEGMMGALGQRAGGRPRAPADEEKTKLRRELDQLRRKLLLTEQRLRIQTLAGRATKEQTRGGRTKKKERVPGDDC